MLWFLGFVYRTVRIDAVPTAVTSNGRSLYVATVDTGGTKILGLDTLGTPVTAYTMPVGLNPVRDLSIKPGYMWGITGNQLFLWKLPDTVSWVTFDDTLLALEATPDGYHAVVVTSPMGVRYRIILVDSTLSLTPLIRSITLTDVPSADVFITGGNAIVAFSTGNIEILNVSLLSASVVWHTALEPDGDYSLSSVPNLKVAGLPSGKVVVAWNGDSTSYVRWNVAMLDEFGNLLWKRAIYPSGWATSNHLLNDLKILNDGRILLVGTIRRSTSEGALVLLDTLGNLLRGYSLNNSQTLLGTFPVDYGNAFIGLDDTGNLLFYSQTLYFGPCDTVPLSMEAYDFPLGEESSSTGSLLFIPSDFSGPYTVGSQPPPSYSVLCTASSLIDTVAPQVVFTYPNDGASNVPETTTITVVFSEAIDTTTFNASNVSLTPTSVSISPYCTSLDTCHIGHTPFPYGATVSVALNSGITDLSSNPLVPYSFSFTVRTPTPSTDTPRIVLTSPDSGEINVPLNANVGVWFSSSIDTNSLNLRTVQIRGWDGSSVVTYTFLRTCPTNLFCVLDPSPRFRPSEMVMVSFSDSITDISGTVPIEPKTIIFYTQEVDTSRPVVVFTLPDSGATGVATNTNVGVQFSKDMDTATLVGNVTITGTSSGAHSYALSCPTLDYCSLDPYPDFAIGEEVLVEFSSAIRSTDGFSLVPKTVVFSTGGGSDTDPPTIEILAPPNDTLEVFNAGEMVRAAVSDGGSGIQRVDWILESTTYSTPTNCSGGLYDDPDTSCFSVPAIPGGTYLLKAVAFDRSSNASYDSVWLVMNDTVPPYIVLSEPADGDVAASPHTNVRLVFSEDMDTSVFGDLRIEVGTSSYTYTYIWESPRTLNVDPSSSFPYDSSVSVLVSDFTDLAGNPMVPDTITFRVVPNASVLVSIVEVAPETLYVGSPDSASVVAVISSPYPIEGAELVLDGDSTFAMFPQDGAYDEVEETVFVRIKPQEEGRHALIVRGYNAYDFGTSPEATLYVLNIPFLSRDNVIVYPNPAHGRAKLRMILGGDAYATVEVFDLKARRVFEKSDLFKGYRTYEIDLPPLPPGLYLLRVKAKGQKVERWFSVVR